MSDTRSCYIVNGIGSQTYGSGSWGSCVLVNCNRGYHVESGECASDTRTCGIANGTGSQTWNGSAYGVCSATACSASYHLESGRCLSDTRSCTIANGTGEQTWDALVGWGTCGAIRCNSSYHIEAGACASDTRTCGIANGTGSQTFASGSWGICGVVTCNSGFHIAANSCTANVISCSLPNATTATQTWSIVTSSYGTCNATACSASYHLEGDACLSDTRTCSPLTANATAGTQTWNSATSTYGSCTVTTCASGYWVNAGVCVLQYSIGSSCTANAQCAAGFCATGPAGMMNDRCAPTGMNYIPAGVFAMGSPSTEVGSYTNETQHIVTLSRSFFLGQTEVTQGQWKALSGGTNPSWFQSTTGTFQTSSNANDGGPVENLDWYAAVAFANARSASEGLTRCYTLTGCTDATNGWKDGAHSGCTAATFAGLTCTGYRLPTESEWEYAARGGTTTATYLGNLSGTVTNCTTAQANLDGIAWWCRNSGNRTNAVGGKSANSFGLFDMLGNVFEWTGDWYGTNPGTVTDPLGPSTGSHRVFRGGSSNSYARDARAAIRSSDTPRNRGSYLGFRLSRTAP